MSSIKEVKELGGLFDSWIKVLIIIGGATVSCGVAYYRIFDNEKNISALEKHVDEQVNLIEERAEKRFSRSMETGKELKEYGMYHEKRILELEREISYLKGLNHEHK